LTPLLHLILSIIALFFIVYGVYSLMSRVSYVRTLRVKETFKDKPSRWREDSISLLSNIEAATRSWTRYVLKLLNDVFNERYNVELEWIGYRLSRLQLLSNILDIMISLKSKIGLLKSLKTSYLLYDIYCNSRTILKLYSRISFDKKAKVKVDKAILKLMNDVNSLGIRMGMLHAYN